MRSRAANTRRSSYRRIEMGSQEGRCSTRRRTPCTRCDAVETKHEVPILPPGATGPAARSKPPPPFGSTPHRGCGAGSLQTRRSFGIGPTPSSSTSREFDRQAVHGIAGARSAPLGALRTAAAWVEPVSRPRGRRLRTPESAHLEKRHLGEENSQVVPGMREKRTE